MTRINLNNDKLHVCIQKENKYNYHKYFLLTRSYKSYTNFHDQVMQISNMQDKMNVLIYKLEIRI